MKKRIVVLLALVLVVSALATGCQKNKKTVNATDDGQKVVIYAWNEEFKGFFEQYYLGTAPYLDTDGDGKADKCYENAPGKKWTEKGIKFEFVINESQDGVYQNKLDAALKGQSEASADNKVDLFLAEADYITKYTNSSYTLDVTGIGVSDFSQTYKYTVDACSDDNQVVKGVSFQACPSALIYRRSVAKDVLGTDDPAEVQKALSDWTKFNAVAATAKEKGYYMTASFAETYRVFSNNCTSAWVDKDNNLHFDDQINNWIKQTEDFTTKGYTIASAGVWDQEKTDQMFATGKTMCFFGPAWYFNFCMGNAQDKEKGCYGDWAIIEGPQAHFWGGTWLLAADGTDNKSIVAEIMQTFTVNEEVMTLLCSVNGQYPNNKKVVEKFANDASYKNEFLGGQNDIAIFSKMTDNIKWQYHTKYDQLLNEKLQTYLQDYFKGVNTKEEALNNYYNYVKTTFPNINIK